MKDRLNFNQFIGFRVQFISVGARMTCYLSCQATFSETHHAVLSRHYICQVIFFAGPNRRQLKVKDPLKFNWRPKELLPQLASIYLHLERADSKGAFAGAIAVSDRYRQDMFPETCQVWLP